MPYFNDFSLSGYRMAEVVVSDAAGNETSVSVKAKINVNTSGGNSGGGGGTNVTTATSVSRSCSDIRWYSSIQNANYVNGSCTNNIYQFAGEYDCEHVIFGCQSYSSQTPILSNVSNTLIKDYAAKGNAIYSKGKSGLAFYPNKCEGTSSNLLSCASTNGTSPTNYYNYEWKPNTDGPNANKGTIYRRYCTKAKTGPQYVSAVAGTQWSNYHMVCTYR